MEFNIEQIGRAVKRLEERMEKRKSVEKTLKDDLQMVLDEYISQEIMEDYVKGWDDKCSSIKIKPCPFCGCTNIIATCEFRPRFICDNCGALGPPGDTSNDAMTIWNTRKG